jgi:glycerol-3-phosphate acyltransferase PlsY
MWALLLPVGYLIGTFPSASLVARANGIDIRSVGSGNPGASNVTRALGWRKGVWVFVLDAAKGSLASGVGLIAGGRPAGYALGAAAVLGHVFPLWKRFRGGKGVATGGGIAAVMAPITFVVLIASWFALSKLTHKASIASIITVSALPVGVAIEQRRWWEVAAVVGVSALVVVRHWGNIRRLLARHEHAIG